MDRAELIASLPTLKRDLQGVDRRIAEAQKEKYALEQIIKGIERLTRGGQLKLEVSDEPAAEDAPDVESGVEDAVTEQPPRGRAAVRAVMSDGRPWQQQAIIAEVKRRGWIRPGAKDPDAAIREAVRRLRADGEVKRVGFATYQLVRPEGDGAGESELGGGESD